jgi:exopolyphosphatase / guanosine-5'-triphosphate,3'-diphosphate pyrophosphatase
MLQAPTVSELLAFIDLGSNAVRCLLVRVIPRVGFEVLRQERVQTRLGGGHPSTLSQASIKETLVSVRRFLRDVRRKEQLRVLAIATAAVREAINREELLAPLRQAEGVDVRVLSGEEEAHLGAFAALRSLSFRHGAVVDLGGSSLQITHVRDGDIRTTASLPLGAVRTTRQFLPNDPPTEREVLALRAEIKKQIASFLPRAHEGQEMIGLGGAVRTLASMHLATFDSLGQLQQGLGLRGSDITRIREQLEKLSIRDRSFLPGLKAERADIILAGTVVVEELMAVGGYKSLTVCKGGVRQGFLLREVFNGGV